MVRISEIQDSLLHLIGWRQGYDTNDGIVISEALTETESGIYYQDAHPLLTLQNLVCIAPDFKNVSYPVYTSKKAYIKGEVVTLEKKYYKAIQNVPANTEITDSEYWAETNPFSEWLEVKTRASITKGINRFINEKVVKGTYKTLCEKKTLFDGTGRIYDLVKNRNNLVGFEIIPIRSKGVTTKINKIGLQFTEPGKYTIIICQSGSFQCYYAETFEKKKANTMEWFTPAVDLYLPYEGEDIEAGGSWYIFYFQSALPEGSQAIKKGKDWSKKPCPDCSRSEYEAWKAWSRYIEVHPFYVGEEHVTNWAVFNNDFNNDFLKRFKNNGHIPYGGLELWDIDKNQYIYDTNFGLNLDITVSCDITDFIIEQRSMFQSFLLLQVASDMLREFAYNANVRTNRHSINASRIDILYELDGDSTSKKKSGVNYQLDLALNAISLSTEGMDRVCMPCINHGLKYRVV